MSNASDRRYAGIKAVNEAVIRTDREVTEEGFTTAHNVFLMTREEAATAIRELAKLGRTERWTNSVEAWAAMVEDIENPFEWAFIQYSVYACHAAE
jgi:hypothetical protein